MAGKSEKQEKKGTAVASTEGKSYSLKSSAVRAAKGAGLEEGEFEIKTRHDKHLKREVFFWERTKSATESMAPQMNEHLDGQMPTAEATSPHEPTEDGEAPKSNISDMSMDELRELAGEEKTDGGAVQYPPPEKRVVDLTPKEVELVREKVNAPKPAEDDVPRKKLVIDDYKDRPAEPKTVEQVVAKVQAEITGNVPSRTTPPGGTPAKVQSPPRPAKVRTNRSTVESPTKLVWHIADEMHTKNPNVARKTVIEECQKRGIAFYTARTQYQQWLAAKRESDRNAAEANGKKK